MRAAFPASAALSTKERRPLAGKTAPRPCARWPAPEQVADAAVAALPARAASMGPVINATDVLLHANLGRRRSSAGAAAAAMLAARPDRLGAAEPLERNGLIRSVRLGAHDVRDRPG